MVSYCKGRDVFCHISCDGDKPFNRSRHYEIFFFSFFVAVYVILGQQFEHIGLLSSLQSQGLLDMGDYFVVGVDLEQFSPDRPDRYLRGLLQNDQEPQIVDAFKAYLAVVPSAPVGFEAFATKVCQFPCLSLFDINCYISYPIIQNSHRSHVNSDFCCCCVFGIIPLNNRFSLHQPSTYFFTVFFIETLILLMTVSLSR